MHTPDNITSLEPHEIFVFGSNLEGNYGGGAAYFAKENFGAIDGIGVGLAGKSYALPTMGGIEQMHLYIEQFRLVAHLMPEYTFLVTKVGCGIAGYKENEISPMFKDMPNNVTLPKGWK